VQGRGEKTRRRLLDAAAVVFAKRGYHAARVDDIVKGARTSHGTFYLYFENKEDLFAALAGEVAERMEQLVEDFPAFGPDDAGRAELEAWLARFTEHYRSSAAILRAWTEAETAGDTAAGEVVGRVGADASSRFVAAIAARFDAAAIPGVEPHVAAVAVVAMIERAHYYVVTERMSTDLATLTATLARVTHAAVHSPR
jgi:AcrR family transcriptional regulator